MQMAEKLQSACDIMGKVNTGMDAYKTLKGIAELTNWAWKYKDAKADSDFLAANRNASHSMVKVLDGLVSIAGGPVYGMVFPVLLKAVDQTIDIMALDNARKKFAIYVTDSDMYGKAAGMSWYDIAYTLEYSKEYKDLAIQIIAKNNGPYTDFAAVAYTIRHLQDAKLLSK